MDPHHGGAQGQELSARVSSANGLNPLRSSEIVASRNQGDSRMHSVDSEIGDFSREDSWLLNVVICSGRDLFVGHKTEGDLFCMLHTFDGVSRSRTVSSVSFPLYFGSTFDLFSATV
jgi:hypothetical protein